MLFKLDELTKKQKITLAVVVVIVVIAIIVGCSLYLKEKFDIVVDKKTLKPCCDSRCSTIIKNQSLYTLIMFYINNMKYTTQGSPQYIGELNQIFDRYIYSNPTYNSFDKIQASQFYNCLIQNLNKRDCIICVPCPAFTKTIPG